MAGDSDGDGLSNDQEAARGTDPNRPDSDADGLSDGDEVLIYATDPTNRDSDGDVLTDFDEINTHNTNPTQSDSDGDGAADGLEVAQGSDPLAADAPADTPTPDELSTGRLVSAAAVALEVTVAVLALVYAVLLL